MTHMRRTTNAMVNYIGRNVPLEIAIPLFIQRLESRTVSNERGCKFYTGSTNSDGYGKVSLQGRSVLIHRWIFEQHHGPIPKGILVCHQCDTPQCWNIDHLFAGTSQDNLQDCAKKGRHTNGSKTHCPRGHDYSVPGNARYNDAGNGRLRRQCVICTRARLRITAGWPKDLAYSMPPQGHGYRPVKANWSRT